MAAPLGNSFWKMAAQPGRPRKFESPEQLWQLCSKYFQWVEENPLYEMKPFAYQGAVIQEAVPKMRAMTLNALTLYLGITEQTWLNYKERKEYFEVISQCEKMIYDQKFSGAAADMLNANIISRDLGLMDKQHIEHGGSIETKQTRDMSDEELEEMIAKRNGSGS